MKNMGIEEEEHCYSFIWDLSDVDVMAIFMDVLHTHTIHPIHCYVQRPSKRLDSF